MQTCKTESLQQISSYLEETLKKMQKGPTKS